MPELVAQLAQETYNTDLLLHLVKNLARFEFESRKDVMHIFNHLLRRQLGSRWPTVEYLNRNHEIIFVTLAGFVGFFRYRILSHHAEFLSSSNINATD